MVISNIDTGLPSKEVVDSLLNTVQEISKNTDTLAGFSGWVTWFSFVASIITIIGLGVFMIEVRKFVVGRKCQKSRYMRLSEDSIGKYIYEYYMDSERIPKYEKEGKMDNSIVIPDRTGDWAFYDNLINEKSCSFNLKEIEDKMIRYRYKTYVNCI